MTTTYLHRTGLTIVALGLAGAALAAAPVQEAPVAAPAGAAPISVDATALRQAHPELFTAAAGKSPAGSTDDIPHPLGEQRRALRAQALEARLRGHGSGSGGGEIKTAPKGQYVELEREGEELIWTVVAEFGDMPSPFFGGAPGPQRNEIPQPGVNNNTTIWTADFNREHYMNILFNDESGANSMRNFYKELSSNRYTVSGDVTDWGSVPYNTAHYGTPYCGSIVCPTTWWFVEDAVNDWYSRQLDAGKTPAEIDDYLSQFDVWDRYDQDGDGNFDEPDGYIDHFQAVHAGEGAEVIGPNSPAIWSHRWYVQLTPIGAGGPTLDDGTVVPNGGTQIGDSKYWIGDYTIEPENGGVGVFAHEYAHDLGLPDLYNTGPGSGNSTGMWTLMSQGSYGNDGTVDLGTKPTHMGAWEKFQLGWLDYDVAVGGQASDHKLGPAAYNSRNPQGLFVIAPDKVVETIIGDPFEGDYFFFSGSGNNLDNFMFREFDLPAGATLTAQVNYDIEVDWDYAYVVVSTDGGASWTGVATNVSTNTDPNNQNFGEGITGASGGWIELTADLSAYTGPVLLGFRYWTDVAAVNPGFMADNVTVTGYATDGGETDTGWTYAGFIRTMGVESASYFTAYVAEYRQYRGYDDALRTGPYVFGYQHDPALVNLVDHFPYQDGVLISFWDTSQSDNNTATHPGEGLILPIDAHPEPLLLGPDTAFPGAVWFGTVQTLDATFGKQPTDSFVLHYNGVPTSYPSLPAVSEFNGNNDYWSQGLPWHGVNPPKSNTVIRVKSGGPKSSFLHIEVR